MRGEWAKHFNQIGGLRVFLSLQYNTVPNSFYLAFSFLIAAGIAAPSAAWPAVEHSRSPSRSGTAPQIHDSHNSTWCEY